MSYRALKEHFDLDDERLDALRAELLYAHPDTVSEDGHGLVWSRRLGLRRRTAPADRVVLRPRRIRRRWPVSSIPKSGARSCAPITTRAPR